MARSEWARQQMEQLDQTWAHRWPFLEALEEDRFEDRLPEGRSIKEVLAHVAFWEEAAVGYVRGAIRGEKLAIEDWYGGESLVLGEGAAWPDADTHNAREAEWALHQPGSRVLDRLQAAREKLTVLLGSVTDEEATGAVGAYFKTENLVNHFEEHLSEIEKTMVNDG